jgi:radical SAM-linked protein
MRIRISFSKLEEMRYTGHLDLFRSWERTFRRSGLPLAYSQGFHPQPRLNLACALPLGFTSECELLDAWLELSLPLEQINQALLKALPPGVQIHGIESIDLHAPALQTQVRSVMYQITFLDFIFDLEYRLDKVIRAEHLPRIRRNKAYDLRPFIEGAFLSSGDAGPQKLQLELSARESATGRPEEVLEEMGIRFEDTRIHRLKIVLAS